MARRIPWRRLCPDVVANRIEEASQARIYLLRETGPTGFLLKEDGLDRKFKVWLQLKDVYKQGQYSCVKLIYLPSVGSTFS